MRRAHEQHAVCLQRVWRVAILTTSLYADAEHLLRLDDICASIIRRIGIQDGGECAESAVDHHPLLVGLFGH